jgi:hypothetical protein
VSGGTVIPLLPRCHHPRKRMIQYSRAGAIKSRGRGVLDTPLARGMTTGLWGALIAPE